MQLFAAKPFSRPGRNREFCTGSLGDVADRRGSVSFSDFIILVLAIGGYNFSTGGVK